MDIRRKLLGAALASSLAFILKGCANTSPQAVMDGSTPIVQVNPVVNGQILCYGVNSCRGQGSCHMMTTSCQTVNSCRGQNACRGKGAVSMTSEECKAKGGITPLVAAPGPQ